MKNIKSFEQFQQEDVNESLFNGISENAEKFVDWIIKQLMYIKMGKLQEPEGFEEAKEVFFKYYEQKGTKEAGEGKIPNFVLKKCDDKKARNAELLAQYEKFKDKIEKKEKVQSQQKQSLLGGPGSRS